MFQGFCLSMRFLFSHCCSNWPPCSSRFQENFFCPSHSCHLRSQQSLQMGALTDSGLTVLFLIIFHVEAMFCFTAHFACAVQEKHYESFDMLSCSLT